MLTDLSVLTPPALVCAAFLVAVIAFLRHEMGRKKSPQDPSSDDISDERPIPGDQADGARAREAAPEHHDSA